MSYCLDCVDGENVLSWLEDGEIKTMLDKCETCNGIGVTNSGDGGLTNAKPNNNSNH